LFFYFLNAITTYGKLLRQNFRYKNFLICFARRSFNEGGAANSLFFAKKENASCLGQLANP